MASRRRGAAGWRRLNGAIRATESRRNGSADAKFIQVDIEAAPADRGTAGPATRLPVSAPSKLRRSFERGLAARTGERRPQGLAILRSAVSRRSTSDAVLQRAYAIRFVLQRNPDVYVVNEGANALTARNIIDMAPTAAPARQRKPGA